MFACCATVDDNTSQIEITTAEAAVSEKSLSTPPTAAEEPVVEEKKEEKQEAKTDEKIEAKEALQEAKTDEKIEEAKAGEKIEEKKEEDKKEEETPAAVESPEIEVSFPLNGKPLGLSLDLANPGGMGAKIIRVKEEGAVAEYNKTAATPVKDGQSIMEVLGTRGSAQELLEAIKANKTDKMTLKLC
eukprot:TRINITY_DN151_c0_g2_i4.p1 TRINITY_DN151_c0_g2~~TRINITY_DN151_c0_g2_i4.p1  ORF type:complete len:187 (-),score=66.71 TRINITY_DN151_c0_g2_i4:252-812(-)